jgi:tetratricopeptide (TPR) repeat protein
LAKTSLLIDDKLWSQLHKEVADWHRKHPEDINTCHIIATKLATTEDDQAKKIAINMFQEMLEEDPSNHQAMSSLAMLLQITGRIEESAELYQQIIRVEPDAVIAINNLTWIMCEHKKNYQQALDLAQSGLQKAPEYVDLIDTRGVIYHKMGQYQDAAQDFTRCIELYPKGTPSLTGSYFHLGRALKAQNQNIEAKNNLQTALRLNDKIGGLSETDLEEAKGILTNLSGNY